jgi:hypothetical protein
LHISCSLALGDSTPVGLIKIVGSLDSLLAGIESTHIEPVLQLTVIFAARALGQHPTDTNRYHAAAVRSFFHLVLALCLLTPPFNPHHRHPRGLRYDTQLRHSRQATRVYIR